MYAQVRSLNWLENAWLAGNVETGEYNKHCKEILMKIDTLSRSLSSDSGAFDMAAFARDFALEDVARLALTRIKDGRAASVPVTGGEDHTTTVLELGGQIVGLVDNANLDLDIVRVRAAQRGTAVRLTPPCVPQMDLLPQFLAMMTNLDKLQLTVPPNIKGWETALRGRPGSDKLTDAEKVRFEGDLNMLYADVPREMRAPR